MGPGHSGGSFENASPPTLCAVKAAQDGMRVSRLPRSSLNTPPPPPPCSRAVARLTLDPPPPPREALEGKAPQRQPRRRVGRRLEGVAQAVGGGYCRLQMPLKPALGVRGTVAGHRPGALEGGGRGGAPPLPAHPCPRPNPKESRSPQPMPHELSHGRVAQRMFRRAGHEVSVVRASAAPPGAFAGPRIRVPGTRPATSRLPLCRGARLLWASDRQRDADLCGRPPPQSAFDVPDHGLPRRCVCWRARGRW